MNELQFQSCLSLDAASEKCPIIIWLRAFFTEMLEEIARCQEGVYLMNVLLNR